MNEDNVELQNDGSLMIPLSRHSNSLDLMTQARDALRDSKMVIFDLADKDNIISQDIGFILNIYKQSDHQNCLIINANGAIKKTLAIAQIDHLIQVG